MNSIAYQEYMKMANNLFDHLKNGTQETREESKKIEERQEVLWKQMTDDEKLCADEQVLRTVLWIKGNEN